MNSAVAYGLLALAVLSLTLGQIVIKARLSLLGPVPGLPADLLTYLSQALGDWQLWGAGTMLVVSAAAWYAAVSRIPLSVAFPFGATSYPLILLASLLVLHEQITWQIVAGNVLIMAGVVLVALGRQL